MTMRTTMPRAGQWRGVATSLLAIVAAISSAPTAAAQNIISVPFTQGFIGTRGSSAGTANNVLTYQTLGISRTFFIQNSSTNSFELQGNDIPGTLRIVRTDGVTLDIPASANWRNSGGTTYLMGILPRPTSPITYTYPGGSISITDGSVNGGSSIGGYLAGYNSSTLTDGASTSGNAAQSQLLSALNAYLTTVVSFRPAGPVTVTGLTTSSTTPTIAGTATVASGEALTVVVAGVQYSTLSSLAVIRNGNSWSLTLTTPLSLGTYDVAATITNANGFTLSDVTLNELVISAQVTTLTVGGSFTANDKVYDGSITATGTTAGLTLLGVNGGDSVTIASATLAFATAAAGTARTVSITAITLGGTHANSYTVNLTGAPTTTAAITQRAATVTGISVAAKVYDGSLTASVTGTAAYGNLAPAETFPVSGTPTATFATKVIGSATPVTITGYAAPSANYTVTQPTGLGASITARPLTLGGSLTATSRPFDGTTAAVIATNALTLTPVVTGDTVSLTTVTATFVDAAVGTAKPVSITAATIGGASAGNYTVSVTGAPTTTASIVAAALPSPPSAPHALVASPGDGSVAITWNAPIDAGCGVIRSYAVETSRDGGSTWTRQVVSAPAGSVTMSALSNNTTYQLRTLATNDCGTSAPSSIVTFVPISVTREGGGAPRTNPAGTATTTINGTATPVVTNVIGDSAVVIGQGTSFTLSVHVVDSARVPIPVDSTRVLSFEQGGNAVVAGRGFKPGTVVTLYLYSNTNPNQPALLAQVTVRADGTFDASSAVSATARPPGSYTVQINGIDEVDALRSVAIGVEVTEPPPELTMTSTADKLAPAPNDTVLITLRITNRGSGPAIDVVIPRAFTEPGFRMLTAVPLHGTYDQPSQTWRIPRIDVGASAVMQITAVLIIAAAAPTPLIVP